MNFKALNSPPSGLTLIEILIVITIIGILASVIVPNLMKKPDQARIVAAKQGISSLVQALQIYKLDNHNYPTIQQGLEALTNKPALKPETPNWAGPYIDRLRDDPWGNKYFYLRTDADEGIEVVSYGADKKIGGEGINADIYSSRF
jgi:general secretion pathway protein G